ncbi:MAG: hypothetical protein LC657_12690, partial [Desulfobacteraceae bacterium]|nr:hypothetical protein [Desulfobacteraceae bacterium]
MDQKYSKKDWLYVLTGLGIFEHKWRKFYDPIAAKKRELLQGLGASISLDECEIKSNWIRIEKAPLQGLVRARALKCRRMVLLGLLLDRKCMDVRLDPAVQSAIVLDPGLEKLSEDILERIRNREAGFSESLSWRFSLLHLRVRDSLPDRIRYLVRLFTMPTVKEWTLCRIIRPIRLLSLGVRLSLRVTLSY